MITEKESLRNDLVISVHAARRFLERSINFDEEYEKVQDIILKLKAKGVKNSLIISEKAAYIVDVNNDKIITAVDKESIDENIFTKIDSTAFIN